MTLSPGAWMSSLILKWPKQQCCGCRPGAAAGHDELPDRVSRRGYCQDHSETRSESGRAIGFAIGAAIAALLLFQAAFNSWRLALVATAALPLSLTGGLIAGLFSGLTFGLGSLLGLLAILGLAARYITTMLSSIR